MSAQIDLDDVHLRFRVRQANKVSLKEYLLRGLFRPGASAMVDVHAIRGVSLQLREGDRLGIVGHNGAGKSTLLKVMAGIYQPTSGSCRVTGRICSLFDIMVGFELEASGWDNIRFRSYLQGETPRTIRQTTERVAEFCELGRFLDVPLKYYSAGMLIRLAFSIASAAEPEVLLIDEALSAGDMNFQVKAKARVEEMMRSASLMVLISHDMDAVRDLCNQAAWMEQGALQMLGDCDDVINAYRGAMSQERSPVGAAS